MRRQGSKRLENWSKASDYTVELSLKPGKKDLLTNNHMEISTHFTDGETEAQGFT